MGSLGQLRPGKCLGKYRIIAEIGRGGMGVVYLAEDTALDRKVAIKILPGSMTSDSVFVESLRQEARIAAGLSHPNIVHIHAFEILDGVPMIEMEYVQGGSLVQRQGHKPITLSDVVRYGHGVSCALSYCHDLGALHRDVKPSNILIDSSDRARLADFGLAGALLDSENSALATSHSSLFRGTPRYAPPEAWEGEAPTRGWDTYSLGAVLFESLTGTPPYQGSTTLELAKKIATTQVEPIHQVNPSVSDSLGALVDEMLVRDPAKRLIDAQEVAERLEETPEFLMQEGHDRRTIVVKKADLKAKIRTRWNQGSRKKLYTVLGGLAALVLLAFLLPLVASIIPSPSPPERDARRGDQRIAQFQNPDNMPATISVGDLLRLSKGVAGGRTAVLKASYRGRTARESEVWLANLDSSGAPTQVTAYGEAYTGVLALSPGDERAEFRATGNWAAFADENGTVLRYGTVSGTLSWSSDITSLSGALTFRQEQDGAISDWAVISMTHSMMPTDTQFIHGLESSDYVQPLIYTELQPRGLPWVGALESLMPCFVDGTVAASFSESKEGEFILDGVLDDTIWRRSEFNGAGNTPTLLKGLPGKATPVARFAYTEDSLLFAMECASTETKGILCEMYIMRTFSVPLSASPVLHISHMATTGETQCNIEKDGVASPVEGEIAFASTVTGGRWGGEGKIPFDAFETNSTPPVSGERWRFNAALYDVTIPGLRKVVARWAFPDEEDVRHGAILRFSGN